MIEKRRRDRMNNCLTDLSRLIPNSFIKKQSSSLQNRGRFKHCLDDLKQQQIMQTETESSSSYSKFIAHLQKEFDNLTIVFALHPSGHYYVPMHIESSILGFDDFPHKLMMTMMTKTMTNMSTKLQPPIKTTTTIDDNHQSNSPPSSMTYKRQLNDVTKIVNEPMMNGNDMGIESKMMMTFNNNNNNNKRSRWDNSMDELESTKSSSIIKQQQQQSALSDENETLMTQLQPLLYPINITVNFPFNRTITIVSLLKSIRDLIQKNLHDQQQQQQRRQLQQQQQQKSSNLSPSLMQNRNRSNQSLMINDDCIDLTCKTSTTTMNDSIKPMKNNIPIKPEQLQRTIYWNNNNSGDDNPLIKTRSKEDLIINQLLMIH
ncbi:platelet binding protein gspb-like [Dermatophagoides farinae]|uniref:Platelet binding protein gspb-like n=1 Tax=Dermatophagoides farinae TaxID=6954 RepID=A0A9D4P8J3_DERFA|nr:platelet binding protein gspb-like [Dermatophagoides farinae]